MPSTKEAFFAAVNAGDVQALKKLNYAPYLECRDKDDMTPSSIAINAGHEMLVNELLTSGASTESKFKWMGGQTVLHLAARFSTLSIVKLLLAHKANVDAQDDEGRTPLIVAAYYGRDEVVRVLLDHGASIDTKDNHGCTALDWAIKLTAFESELTASELKYLLRTHDKVKKILLDYPLNKKLAIYQQKA